MVLNCWLLYYTTLHYTSNAILIVWSIQYCQLMIMLQQKWLYNKLVDTSLNLEERLEDILKTEISSSLYYVNNELGTFIP